MPQPANANAGLSHLADGSLANLRAGQLVVSATRPEPADYALAEHPSNASMVARLHAQTRAQAKPCRQPPATAAKPCQRRDTQRPAAQGVDQNNHHTTLNAPPSAVEPGPQPNSTPSLAQAACLSKRAPAREKCATTPASRQNPGRPTPPAPSQHQPPSLVAPTAPMRAAR